MTDAKLAYSIIEASEVAGVGRSKLYQDIKDGRLRTFKIGKRRLVSPKDLEAYVEEYRSLGVAA